MQFICFIYVYAFRTCTAYIILQIGTWITIYYSIIGITRDESGNFNGSDISYHKLHSLFFVSWVLFLLKVIIIFTKFISLFSVTTFYVFSSKYK